MQVVIVDYDAGNIYSVVRAMERLGVSPLLTRDREKILQADKVILPGQGEASNAMQSLQRHGLDQLIPTLRQPVLGICIGQQLMCERSEEGNAQCMGVFDVPVVRFRPQKHEEKIPHMGWNAITDLKSPLMQGLSEGDYVYFIHSFYVPPCAWTIATTEYILPFSAALHRDNFYATQFHPEKSGSVGERILSNFLKL